MPTNSIDSVAFAAFLDSLMTAELRRERSPGAALAFVKDGRVVHLKGYGNARLEIPRAVDPMRTIWRIGSISKTFTATAVVQLSDQGRLDLRADVNNYLSLFKVPSTYPVPVRVADLLTHTAGLDEIRPGTQAASAVAVLPLPEFLRTRLVRFQPPGETIAYSTYGISVAGALVEAVSGLGFEQYAEQRIWRTLGMTRTNITVPDSMQGDVAIGYEWRGDSLISQSWEWYHTTPASSVNSTAADMARYMIALLESGPAGDGRILSQAAMREMLRQHVTMHPRLPGVTLGFWEDYVGELRVVEHGGNMAGFSSHLMLIPAENAGLFVVSHLEGSSLRDNVKQAVLEHLFPKARLRRPVPPPPADFATRAEEFVGRYAQMSSCHSCIPRRVPYILDISVRDNALFFSNRRWIEVEPMLFVREDGTGYIAFRPDSTGKIAAMFAGGFWSFEKLPATSARE